MVKQLGTNVLNGNHGDDVARKVREAFRCGNAMEIDFSGVKIANKEFFQKLVLSLVAEYGAEYLKTRFRMTNLMPDLRDTLDEAMSDTRSYLDSVMAYTAEDQEIYEINLTMLLKARELSKENQLLAKIIFGMQDEEMIAILETATLEDLQRLASSGITCFTPRFDTRALRTFMNQSQDDEFGILLPIIAGMESDQKT